jgi:sarcosine oxidase subunit gamma
MPETLQRPVPAGTGHPIAPSTAPKQALVAGWREGLAIVNLRGPADERPFNTAVTRALGVAAPLRPCTSAGNAVLQVVWAGPDSWFVIGSKGEADRIATALRNALAGLHHSVTDVSSGYTVLHLSGAPVRDVLAQGCPLDLHPREFKTGMSAGSHYFKAAILLWQTDEAPTYELLVRGSFMRYFWSMLERCSPECGLVTRRFV